MKNRTNILRGEQLADTLGYGGDSPFIDAGDCVGCQRVDTSAMSADFVIVTRTGEPNRHGSKVHILPNKYGDGLRTDNYERNPIVMFGHGLEAMPVGGVIGSARNPRTGQVELTKHKDRAESRVFFSQSLPEAETVFALVAEGILQTASIQFMPLKAKPIKSKRRDDDTLTVNGAIPFDFVESDLWEWSIVPIPADPAALHKCVDSNRCGTTRIAASVKPILERCCEPRSAWAPGVDLQSKCSCQSKPTVVELSDVDVAAAAVDALADGLNEIVARDESISRRLAAVAQRVIQKRESDRRFRQQNNVYSDTRFLG